MRLFFGKALVVLGVSFSQHLVYAEDAVEPIYVVDMQRVISESVMGKAAKNTLEAEIKKREGQLQKLSGDLKALKGDLEKQAALLSPEALKEKRESLEKKEREFQRTFQDQREEIGKKNNEEIGKVVKQIDLVVQEIAKERGYRFIMERDSRVVIYADKRLDLTDEVVEALDSKKVG